MRDDSLVVDYYNEHIVELLNPDCSVCILCVYMRTVLKVCFCSDATGLCPNCNLRRAQLKGGEDITLREVLS